jgi:hypothetical protein
MITKAVVRGGVRSAGAAEKHFRSQGRGGNRARVRPAWQRAEREDADVARVLAEHEAQVKAEREAARKARAEAKAKTETRAGAAEPKAKPVHDLCRPVASSWTRSWRARPREREDPE